MRLVNVRTLERFEFMSKPPKYAVLSHTWGEEELLFQDFYDLERARRKLGFMKVEGACRQAKSDGFDFIWIDTVCVDKSSTAEISEGANSVWTRFQESGTCYVYLTDVSSADEVGQTLQHGYGGEQIRQFQESRWFTRAWTLQELLAPPRCFFFDHNWELLGSRANLAQTISKTTGIDHKYLNDPKATLSATTSLKMQWLSRRETTRPEDIAYCVMGLFNVNMPILYGEGGDHAFQRLQEEVLRNYGDLDIFKWYWKPWLVDTWKSVFAPSPEFFSRSDQEPRCTDHPCWKRNAWNTKSFFVRESLKELNIFTAIQSEFGTGQGNVIGDTSTAGNVESVQPSFIEAYEDSISDGDVGSVFSYAESSVSSMSSVSIDPIQTIGIREAARALLSHDELKDLCITVASNMNRRKARAHMRGFLKEYGRNLDLEASRPIETEAARFVKLLAGRLADEIIWIIDPMDNHIDITETKSRRKGLEGWLASMDTGENRDQENTLENLVNDENDNNDPDSDGEPDETAIFPKLGQVKEFLLVSEAFEILIRALKTWLKVDDRQATEADSGGVITDLEDIKAKNASEAVSKTDDAETKEALTKTSLPKDEHTKLKDSGPNLQSNPTLVRVETAGELDRAQTNYRSDSNQDIDGLEDFTSEPVKTARRKGRRVRDLLSGLLDFWGISLFLCDVVDLFTPRVPPGHVRIRWRCSCNTVLWGDFPDKDRDALDQLRRDLSGSLYMTDLPLTLAAEAVLSRPTTTPSNPGSSDPPPNQVSHTPGPARKSSTSPEGLPNSKYEEISIQPRSYIVNIDTASLAEPKYFEVCVNSGNHAVTHHELDISRVANDSDLFELIWDKYNASRGIGMRRLFLRPRDVHFVMFSVERSQYGAGIHKKPDEFPPEEELQHKRYHYLSPKIMMPAHWFLHYLHRARWNVWGEHSGNTWLQRLPKKLNEGILAATQVQHAADLQFGWGVHIIDGPNHATLGFLLAVVVLVTFLISVLIVGLAKTQEQAFGVGSYLLAVVTCVMAAIYYNLTDQ